MDLKWCLFVPRSIEAKKETGSINHREFDLSEERLKKDAERITANKTKKETGETKS